MALLLASFLLASISVASPTSTKASACTATLNGKLPSQTPVDFEFNGNVRKYYIAAEEVVWDYAPSGWDNMLGLPLDVSPRAQAAGYTQYGTKWKKAVYRGYKDASFTEQTPQPPWQGIQGPTLRSEVGDMIEILFINRLPQHYATMHSMGLSYTKEYEGSLYPTGSRNSTPAPGDAVAPGGCAVYKWVVPESAAPPAGQPSHMHGYHSYISMLEDLNAGLAGPQITYARGKMEHTVSHYHEVPLYFMGFDESKSILTATNKQSLTNSSATLNATARVLGGLAAYGNSSYWRPQLVNSLGAAGLDDAPMFYALNGYVMANSAPFEFCLNDEVIWYVYAHGTEPHTFHMHGHGFQTGGINKDAISINDGEMFSLFMKATTPGTWQAICHVDDHLMGGMVAYYTVSDTKCPNKDIGGIMESVQL
ncbi:hypothetical protein ASPWEDRAFT_39581 [Aspergillus wentii DTO 134E9]|uniref:Plastocyanin-like domain-containing protein n=1 Tax=Aspergillus wentii DTO 134E9 TaxID=1073089 RepID=A0A1L9RSD0_ASPWE|nr:uncharacterized protein ASPWEDRAFT_39581 [Aspergillus wentii DTO 134E9]KAI9930690.1 hypothetical protein MW887_011445 [Aspergillus wentii]OJJ37851.1 hypothetical protein ASPWEDRAFT_39581 [Aspergillus wentii DTO 134E9]